jgi:ubiquitin-conjugating enzyme E2 Q
MNDWPLDRRCLERKVKPGKAKPRLKGMENGSIVRAAWAVLRWCVASCTAYLEEMSETSSVSRVSVRILAFSFISSSTLNDVPPLTDALPLYTDSAWRQFRFSAGAPDTEAKFQKVLQNATTTDANAQKYSSLYVRAPLTSPS